MSAVTLSFIIAFVLGEYIFPRLPYITNLTIQGPINSINYFNTIKEEFVYLNHNPHLEDDVVFQSSVHLKGNLGTMSGINEINLSELLSRAVWITQDTHLEGPVAFKHSLECMKPLKVKQQLITKSLFNENLQDLVNNGVFIDKGILKGPYFFDEAGVRGKFYARFLNDIDMNLIIPLKTEQNISRLDVDDMQLTHDVAVGQHVHGKILMMEKVNTFSRNIEQHVDSKIVFSNNVLVEKTLTAFNLNNKSVSDIVTTNTDQNLTATYNFMSKVVTNDNLIGNASAQFEMRHPQTPPGPVSSLLALINWLQLEISDRETCTELEFVVRIIYLIPKFNSKYSIQVTQAYAPTAAAPVEEIEQFYEGRFMTKNAEKTKFNIPTGHFNAKIERKTEADHVMTEGKRC
ncbi:hypothetical protein HUJ05_002167 [Dendroctonus ponderosae]|nr:hypothetical protein HUJ05_002167 [Dendroctonus ponderosae]